MRFDQNSISWPRQRQPQELQKYFNILELGKKKKTSQAGGLSGWSVTFQVLRRKPEVQLQHNQFSLGVFDTDKLSSVGCTIQEGRCVSFRSENSNFLFVQNGWSIIFPPWCHFKGLLGTSTECLRPSGQHCSIFWSVRRGRPGPLWT